MPVPPARLHVFDASHPHQRAARRRRRAPGADRLVRSPAPALAPRPSGSTPIVPPQLQTAIADRLPAAGRSGAGQLQGAGRRLPRSAGRTGPAPAARPGAGHRHRARWNAAVVRIGTAPARRRPSRPTAARRRRGEAAARRSATVLVADMFLTGRRSARSRSRIRISNNDLLLRLVPATTDAVFAGATCDILTRCAFRSGSAPATSPSSHSRARAWRSQHTHQDVVARRRRSGAGFDFRYGAQTTDEALPTRRA